MRLALLFLLVAASVGLFFVARENQRPQAQAAAPVAETQPHVYTLSIYADPLNGCQYLAYRYDSGLVPRVDPNGKHICPLP